MVEGPITMLTLDNPYLQALGNSTDLARIRPFLREAFDPVSLERPGFLAEVALTENDGLLLKAGALAWPWLRHPAFYRALAEEFRGRKIKPTGLEAFLPTVAELSRDEQWLLVGRIFSRLEQLAGMRAGPSPTQVAAELGLELKAVEQWRARWREQAGQESAEIAIGILLQLLDVGITREQLCTEVRAQWLVTRMLVFQSERPLLTDVGQVVTEVQVRLDSGRVVRKSMAENLRETEALEAEIWARDWLEYLGNHTTLQADELAAFIDHLGQKERYRWAHRVAVKGAKAERAVAAVANKFLELIDGAPDPNEVQRLFALLDNFSERHQMEAILKRRFGA